MAYGNIKYYAKGGPHPLSKEQTFGKKNRWCVKFNLFIVKSLPVYVNKSIIKTPKRSVDKPTD